MMTDPISDMLTRIRNASKVRKQIVDVPMSKMKFALAKVLQNEGYLDAVEKVDGLKGVNIRLRLKYENNEPKIMVINRISRPGRRVYVQSTELPTVRSGFGVAIVSTPNGLMTNVEARKRRLGGELICEVY
ncbi:MAG: 30S ribosomal protein S8 [Candidatus Uhrbacteria bacterium GW2011_GWD2_41_121]|uniref:Small ribosomal subunit protein uS8 n=1 Tax=Candidatus Uhrbacteria bacterium GW2011_GWC1_41_20 TaxID=1618983 RepID=A0A0G0YG61_9BACT|nr:MAG: 30S ribosomal protein S8 [Candidatus Uhrbacteria bacterium GW2011_GWE1_39_46]KKR64088.1 MAG: 30S ribosomal protein S8 [Candidatus Uhrbacteria bacterium GW2011_GWC2_40_450]KKR90013.1 MAG: 30S ribosomal protein S8 [Candidatus Uhrbacteria bacterium GW2011_GWD2_41_121]KKR90646.1 MAG: 30S ribosomal protein S8 [Candidatus Uhrbacteria bacterium GW2011_GWE2_41_1153]KKR99347.1 MAG: 30S ribosomal protein S8 [Candidatus Uhrbacteria bacterium GW2011_GWC1_41_20]KKS06112.1 MAG: 30S ribosomal protein